MIQFSFLLFPLFAGYPDERNARPGNTFFLYSIYYSIRIVRSQEDFRRKTRKREKYFGIFRLFFMKNQRKAKKQRKKLKIPLDKPNPPCYNTLYMMFSESGSIRNGVEGKSNRTHRTSREQGRRAERPCCATSVKTAPEPSATSRPSVPR